MLEAGLPDLLALWQRALLRASLLLAPPQPPRGVAGAAGAELGLGGGRRGDGAEWTAAEDAALVRLRLALGNR